MVYQPEIRYAGFLLLEINKVCNNFHLFYEIYLKDHQYQQMNYVTFI